MTTTFTKLENEWQLQKYDLDSFAASFDHKVTRLFPVWVAHINGKLISYCHVRKQVVAYPAVHPSISPREMYTMGREWLKRLKMEHGDPVMVMPERFEPKLLTKMGLTPVNGNVYTVSY